MAMTMMNLTALTGTPKQIAWAERIRQAWLDQETALWNRIASAKTQPAEQVHFCREFIDSLKVRMLGEVSAAWWIEHQNESMMAELQKAVRAARA